MGGVMFNVERFSSSHFFDFFLQWSRTLTDIFLFFLARRRHVTENARVLLLIHLAHVFGTTSYTCLQGG